MSGGKRPGPRPGRRGRVVLAAGVVLLGLLLGPPVAVRGATAGHEHGGPGSAPAAPVAIVLGAGIQPDGRPSVFLQQRITTAVELYRAGKVRALLMSGDHSRTDHDEVGVMAAEAVRLGVPASLVVQDHAGFDTYSSCYRARSVWGISKALVVSQSFHLPRAVWLCRALGLDAAGVATAPGPSGPTRFGQVREIPAIHKAVLDVWRGRQPRFPGPREHDLDAITAAGR